MMDRPNEIVRCEMSYRRELQVRFPLSGQFGTPSGHIVASIVYFAGEIRRGHIVAELLGVEQTILDLISAGF